MIPNRLNGAWFPVGRPETIRRPGGAVPPTRLFILEQSSPRPIIFIHVYLHGIGIRLFSFSQLSPKSHPIFSQLITRRTWLTQQPTSSRSRSEHRPRDRRRATDGRMGIPWGIDREQKERKRPPPEELVKSFTNC